MFDGNHRTRRVVNLGSRQSQQRAGIRQQQQQKQQLSSSRGQGSNNTYSLTPLAAGLFGANNVGQDGQSSFLATSNVLEETKRRREERRIQQLHNRSATNVQRRFRGARSRQQTLSDLECRIHGTMGSLRPPYITDITEVLTKSIQKLTVFLNLLFLVLEQQNAPLQTFNYWLNLYGDAVDHFDSLNEVVKPPAPYTAKRIVKTSLLLLLQMKGRNTSSLNGSGLLPLIAENRIIRIVSFIIGLGTNTVPISLPYDNNTTERNLRSIRWKQLGGGYNFLLLMQCYQCQTEDIGHEAKQQLLNIIREILPNSSGGMAIRGALALLSPIQFTDLTTLMNSSDTLFYHHAKSLLPWILKSQSINVCGTSGKTDKELVDQNSSERMTTDNRNDTKMVTVEVEETFKNLNRTNTNIKGCHKLEEKDEQEDMIMHQALQSMFAESMIPLVYNCLALYKLEMKNSMLSTDDVVRATSLIVLLLHFLLVGERLPSSAPSEVISMLEKDQRTVLTILAGRIVRGDDIFAKGSTSGTGTIVTENDSDNEFDEEDYHDDDNAATSKSFPSSFTPVLPQATTTPGTSSTKKHKGDRVNGQKGKMESKNYSRYNSSVAGQLKKNDIQTLLRLDRLYAKEVQETIMQCNSSLLVLHSRLQKRNETSSTLSIPTKMFLQQFAQQFTDPELILHWGRILLGCDNSPAVSTVRRNDSFVLIEAARRAYVTVLAVLLQLTTGLRSRQNYMSPFLTKLAFTSDFTALLWKYFVKLSNDDKRQLSNRARSEDITGYLSPSTYLSASVFCDLFSHSLIATKDDVFMTHYTNRSQVIQDSSQTRKVLLASEIVEHLRDILYELYWSKPVQVTDFRCIVPSLVNIEQSEELASKRNYLLTHAARARLFLTGTKLWNALYERWNRLMAFSTLAPEFHSVVMEISPKLRHVMCEESSWWFPSMTSLLGVSSHIGGELSQESSLHATRSASYRTDNNGARDDDMSVSSESDDDNTDQQQNQNVISNSVADSESDELAEAFSDPRMARILTCIPQAIPFDKRVKLFDALLKSDKRNVQAGSENTIHAAMLARIRGDGDFDDLIHGSNRHLVEIRRDRLYEDSMKQLNVLDPSKLKRRIQVSFINQHGAQEAGIDGGGVFKEFIDDLIKDAFSIQSSSTKSNDTNTNHKIKANSTTSSYQLFTATPLQTLKINSDIFHTRRDVENLLPHYEFLGRVLGKAVYESILVDPQFCLPFLNQLLGKTNSMEDLKNYDPEYYRNLTKLLQLTESELEGLGLTFELTTGTTSKSRTIELIPGGSNKPVRKENVIQYIYLVAHQRLNVETALPTRAFLRGFRDLIPASWVRLFSAYELQKLISGDDSIKGIDVKAFKQSMKYAAGYHESQPIIEWFWEIVEEMTADQQHKLLKFMTSCSRQPLLGFDSLTPSPCIQQIRIPEILFSESKESIVKQTPLPSSSTCMNLLKLPNYRWKELMRQKLLAAIESGAGFELT